MGRQKNDGRGKTPGSGRKAGTPNKATKSIRDIITTEWEHYAQSGQLRKDILNLEPLDRLQTMEKYAQYIGAKLKAIELDADITQTGTTAIETTLRNLIQLPDP